MSLEEHVRGNVMASQTSERDVGSGVQNALHEYKSSELPSSRLLGKGLCGIVYETMLEGSRYARKDFVEVPEKIFRVEASVLIGLEEHKNVVKTCGLAGDERSCSLVLEYMDEDLVSLLQKRKESKRNQAGQSSENFPKASRLIDSSLDKFIEEKRKKPFAPDTSPPPLELQEALDVMLQIAMGMAHLHERNIAHGDLKPRNILVCYLDEGEKLVKVADFGLLQTKTKSMFFVSRWARKLDMAQWKAPEYLDLVLGQKLDAKSMESDSDGDEGTENLSIDYDWLCRADVYSFGVTCFQILTGEVPYTKFLNWKELVDAILSQGLRPKLPPANFQSMLLLNDLLESCWGDAAQRPTFSTICSKLSEIIQLKATGGDENLLSVPLIPKHVLDIKQALLPKQGRNGEGYQPEETSTFVDAEDSTQGVTGIDMQIMSKHSSVIDTVLEEGAQLGDVQIMEGGSIQTPPVIPTFKNPYSTTSSYPSGETSAATHPLNETVLPNPTWYIEEVRGTATWDIEEGMGTGVYDYRIHLGLRERDIERIEGMKINYDDDALRAYYEVKRLMWIKQNTVYSVALDRWDQKVKLLSKRMDKREKQSGVLENKIYQLIWVSLVMQVVLLSAVVQLAQSSNEYNNCKKVWSPVILTAFVWIVTVDGVWRKLSRVQIIDDVLRDEDEVRRDVARNVDNLRNYGNKFKFKFNDFKVKMEAPRKLYYGFGRYFWINRFGVIVVTLSVFTGIIIASHFLVLCNRGLAPIHLYN